MRKQLTLFLLLTLAERSLNAATPSGPILQWYKSISGSGASTAVAVATDAHGDLYIAGNTTSLDLPTVGATQKNAGASPLMRINPASGASQNLYAPLLAAAQSIAVDPENPQTVYAATPSAILRSADGGNTFAVLPNFPAVTQVWSVTVDPTNSNNLYAGTTPLGAFKSADAGVTWNAINNGIALSSNDGTDIYGHLSIVTSLNVSQLWVDPKSPSAIFASAGQGLYRSPDAGATWTLSLGINSFRGFLAFDPFTPGTIYAQGVQVEKSTDEGLTWTPTSWPVGAVVPDPLHKGTLYVTGSYSSGAGLYQSTDGGNTWNLKIKGNVSFLTADPAQPVFYACLTPGGIVKSTDGFTTYSGLGPPAAELAQIQLEQLRVAGANLFAVLGPTTDIFVTKLDPSGNILFSTYFGGSASDTAAGMVTGNDGSVYVTGQTTSIDFPITTGVYSAAFPSSSRSNFVFKLNPDGSLAWSTYFADASSTVNAIAVDSGGSPYIAGTTYGNLPTTPGAYQPKFVAPNPCTVGFIGLCEPPVEAFVAKLNSQASALTFSTYIGSSQNYNPYPNTAAVALDSSGDAYVSGGQTIFLLNASGSTMLASTTQPVNINAIALDGSGNVYAAGSTENATPFPATAGAFQSSPQPAVPSLADQGTAGGIDAFVMKFDAGLDQILAATLLGGESTDVAWSIAIDPSSGYVILGGDTDSMAFPTRAPFQGSFAPRSGFVAGFDPTLSQLLFSTYLGGAPSFAAAGAVPDGSGNILLAGSVLSPNSGFESGDPGFPYTIDQTVIANKIVLAPAPPVRLDSVVNFASQLGGSLAPGEAIAAIGAGFGSGAQLVVDGTSLQTVSVSPARIVAVMPSTAPTTGTRQITVSSGGASSNTVLMPSAPASPGIYSADGSGFGQGYILNADGTLNTPSNPAATGSAIRILATGVGQTATVSGYAVTPLPVAVFIDGFYANGIAATLQQVAGDPGAVYEIGVYVPNPAALAAANPNLNNFAFPPLVPVTIFIGAVSSQNGIALSIK